MDKYPSPRGLINDLVRTLTAAIVHVDDMLLNLDRNLEEYDDAILADEQLSMALGYLIELRSLIIGEREYEKKDKNQNLFIMNDKINLLNNLLTYINLSIDLLLECTDETVKSNIAKNIINSIDIIKRSINEYYKEPSIKIMKKNAPNKTLLKNIMRNNKKIMLVEE